MEVPGSARVGGFGGAHDVDEELLLAAPAAVDGGLADPGGAGDALDGQLGEGYAVLQELHHAFEDGAFHGRAAGPAPRGWRAAAGRSAARLTSPCVLSLFAAGDLSRQRRATPPAGWRGLSRRVLDQFGSRARRAAGRRWRPARQEDGDDDRADQGHARAPQGGDVHGVQEGVVGRGDQGLAARAELLGDAEGGLDGLARGVAAGRAGSAPSLSSMPSR